MVVDALQHVGAARSIVIDEDNVILAGNGVTEAAAEAGITKVRVVDAGGDELIAVRRSGLSDEQKRALAIYDNRTGELASWNFEQLAADKEAGLSLQPYWSEREEAALFDKQNDVNEHWASMPEFDQANQMAWRRLIVNFKNQEDLDEFSRLLNQTLTNKTRSIWYPAEMPQRSVNVYVSESDADA